MNSSILFQSLKYIVEYKNVIKLSKYFYKHLRKILYTDTKFKKSVIYKQLGVAESIAKYVIHKDLFIWKNLTKEHMSYHWIQVFKTAKLTIVDDEALLENSSIWHQDSKFQLVLYYNQEIMSSSVKNIFKSAALKIVQKDKFKREQDFEIIKIYINKCKITKYFIKSINLKLLKADNYKLLNLLQFKLSKENVTFLIEEACKDENFDILKHIDDIASYVNSYLVKFLFMCYHKNKQFIDYFEAKGHKFSINIEEWLILVNMIYDVDSIKRSFQYRNFELTQDVVIEILENTGNNYIIKLLASNGVVFDQQMVLTCMAQKGGYVRLSEMFKYNAIHITDNILTYALSLDIEILEVLLVCATEKCSDDLLLKAVYIGNADKISLLLRHGLKCSDAYALAQELRLFKIVKTFDICSIDDEDSSESKLEDKSDNSNDDYESNSDDDDSDYDSDNSDGDNDKSNLKVKQKVKSEPEVNIKKDYKRRRIYVDRKHKTYKIKGARKYK